MRELQKVDEHSHKLKFSMKSAFPCLICPLNLNLDQELTRKAKR